MQLDQEFGMRSEGTLGPNPRTGMLHANRKEGEEGNTRKRTRRAVIDKKRRE